LFNLSNGVQDRRRTASRAANEITMVYGHRNAYGHGHVRDDVRPLESQHRQRPGDGVRRRDAVLRHRLQRSVRDRLRVARGRTVHHDQRMVETIDRRRRRLAIGIVAATVVAVAVEVVAVANPWKYVYLMALGHAAFVTATAAAVPVALGVAASLVLRDKWLVRVVGVLAAALTLAVCAFGVRLQAINEIVGTQPAFSATVVAVSPDDAFELVLVHNSAFMVDHDVLRVRTRMGLFSRESTQDLACFAKPFDPLGPEDTFSGAVFLGDHEIEVRTDVGPAWTTTFDRSTLLAPATLNHGCEL
jgi:hypothetical protein